MLSKEWKKALDETIAKWRGNVVDPQPNGRQNCALCLLRIDINSKRPRGTLLYCWEICPVSNFCGSGAHKEYVSEPKSALAQEVVDILEEIKREIVI